VLNVLNVLMKGSEKCSVSIILDTIAYYVCSLEVDDSDLTITNAEQGFI